MVEIVNEGESGGREGGIAAPSHLFSSIILFDNQAKPLLSHTTC
jgi:hypothetical protein